MPCALTPELSVADHARSLAFYCDVLGFELLYARPEEGFACLRLGTAVLMIDQIGLGRDFHPAPGPNQILGLGVNLQIEVPDITPLLAALAARKIALYLPAETRWYRNGSQEFGQRQFIVADPDGYLLRFAQNLGQRKALSDAV